MNRKALTISALNSWEKKKFKYGNVDCCQFAAHVVKHISGKDYAEGFAYNSESEAGLLISKFGSLQELITKVLGEPSDNLLYGDPVISCFPVTGETMGIKLGDKVVCLTEKGLIKLSNNHQVCGWSICHK